MNIKLLSPAPGKHGLINIKKAGLPGVLLYLCLTLAFLSPGLDAVAQERKPASAAQKQQAQSWMQQSAASSGFTENKGQIKDQNGKANPAVKFLLNMPGLNVQLRKTGFSYDAWLADKSDAKADAGDDPAEAIPGHKAPKSRPVKYHRVDVELEGANPDAKLIAEQPTGTGVTNYIGDAGKFNGIRDYRKVTYRDIYPGIDLEFVAKRGKDKPVEYNFIVHPGADASLIKMKYNSDADIDLKNGEIAMKLAFGTLTEKIPSSFILSPGGRKGEALAVQYKPLDEVQDMYAFNVPDYDRSKTLVIDPTPSIVWATYCGGPGEDRGLCITADANGNIYLGGYTTSTSGIATAGTFQTSRVSSGDGMLVKFSSAGARLWGTYISGGPVAAQVYGVGANGTYIYAVGYSSASNLGTAGTYQPTYSFGNASNSAFLLKFNISNGTLNMGTYFGNSSTEFDEFYSIAFTSIGDIIVGGWGTNTGLATAGTVASSGNGILAKFSPAGARIWSTYVGSGNWFASGIFGLSCDASNNIYVAGGCTTAPATTGAYQTAAGPGFVAKLNSTATAVNWCSYYNGLVYDVMLDGSNNVAIAGTTSTATGVASPGAYQTALAGSNDLFAAKFSNTGTRLWGTYFGGTGNDAPSYTNSHDISDIDENGNIILSAITGGTIPVSNCTYQAASNGGSEDILVKISADGASMLWASYLGTAGTEYGSGVKYLGNGVFVVCGFSTANGLGTAGTYQPSSAGGFDDAYIAKFNEGALPSNLTVSASTIAPLSQTACVGGLPATITGNSITVTSPTDFTSGTFYQWQQAPSATGPWTNLTGETFANLTPPTGSSTYYYRRLVKVNSGYCNLTTVDSSAAATVNISANIAPTVSANGPQWYLCAGNTVTLNGTATPAGSATITSTAWYVGSSTTAAVGTLTYTPTVAVATTYTLKVTDNNGCVNIDQVNVTPVAANAGPAQSYCAGTPGIQIGGTPVGSPKVVYTWTPATGLSCTTCAQPFASPASTTTYTQTATVTRKDNTTCATTSTVVVTPIASPGASFAGTDKTICKASTVVLGTANASYTYVWTPGTYLNNVTLAQPTFSAGSVVVSCPLVYSVSATQGGCTFYDQTTVSVIDPDIDYGGQTLCSPGWVSGTNLNANCTGATYAWNVVSGPGSVVTYRNGNADAYLQNTGPSGGSAVSALFKRTTTVNTVGCQSLNAVTINNCGTLSGCSPLFIKQLSDQGCPKVFGTTPLQLGVGGITTADYTFSWSPVSLVDNPTASTVNIYATAPATISVTVTNKYVAGMNCTATLPINAANWAQPVFNLSDKNTCAGVPVNIGATSVAGYTYAWSPAAGLNSTGLSNPTATIAASTSYTAVVTETLTGCKNTKSVNVNVSNIAFDAGTNRAVCNNGVATLGTTPGGTYTYAWTPVNAAFQNGTSATSANPQVLFGGASPQTYGVTVTDPLTGCTLTDAVTLSPTVTTGTYAGSAPASICPGGSATIGAAAQTGASYLWSPATGLSCTTCAQPTASPAATTSYTVSISYPGCTTPLSDNVSVAVYTLGAHNFPDVTACVSAPAAIGGTVTGATAYSWTPASGLSCTACSTPNANPTVATKYTATISYGVGCSDTDQVTVSPKFSASAKPDASTCVNTPITLGLPAAAAVTYSWSPATYLSCTACAQPVATPTAAGSIVYTLTATGTGVNAGCTVTDAMTLKVIAAPAAFTISGNTTLCAGESTTLSNSLGTTTNYIYQWSPAAGVASPNAASTTITPTVSAIYKLIQTDIVSGCSNFQQVAVAVNANPITATGGNISVCTNNTGVTLPLTTNGTYTYSWTPAAFLNNYTFKNPTTYATSTTAYSVVVTDNTSNCHRTAYDSLFTGVSCSFAVSGSIVRDANGYTDNTVNATGSVTTIPSGTYVSLVDASNKVIATTAVAANGSYSFSGVVPGTYSLVISTSSAGSASPILPGGYMSTGAIIGTGTGGGTNTTGQLPGIVVGSADISNANIAIQQRPTVNNTTATLNSSPAANAFITLNSGTTSALSGTDAEDQPASGSLSGKKVVITSLPANGELWYNGTQITVGADGLTPPSATNPFNIPGYDPSLLQFKKTGSGYSSASFGFAYVDASGTQSTPGTYTIGWLDKITAQNITTPPANGPETIPALIGYDQSGSPITGYTVNAPTSGTLQYCSNGASAPACTGGSLTTVSSSTPLTPAQSQSLYFTPAPGTTGTPTFTYTATSANGTSNTATVSMPIYNLPPVATSTVTAPVTQNSTANTAMPPLQATDIDGTISSYSVTAPAAAQGTLKYCAAAPTACTAASLTSITASGTVSLTPAQSASLTFTPANGFSGTAAFTFTATDNSSNVSNAATVRIPVTPGGAAPANMPPVTQSYVTEPISNTAGNTPVPGLMGTDPDGSIASYTITTAPTAAQGTLKYCAAAPTACTPASLTSVPIAGTTTLTPAQAASLQFSPNPTNAGGLATFSYTATDNYGTPATSNISTVTIPVQNPAPLATNVNSLPVTPGSYNAPVSAPFATDNGSIATYTITPPNTATQGTLSYCSNGTSPCTGTVTPVSAVTPITPAQAATLVFSPVFGFTGTIPVSYIATDNNGLASNPAMLSIPVQELTLPSAKDYTATTNANAPSLGLGAALSGTPNTGSASPISSYTITTIPPATQGSLQYCSNGTAAPACTGGTLNTASAGTGLTPAQAASLIFVPVATYTGPANFTYTATDAAGIISNTANVTVNVINQPPVANNVTTAATTPGGAAVTVPIAGSDPDGSVSSYKITSLPPVAQGALTYCNTGVLPGCTQTAVTAGQVLTPAQAATVNFTPAATANSADVSFTYSVTDNSGAVSNNAIASIPVDPIVPKSAVLAQNITTAPASGAQKVPALVAADQGGSPITGYTVNAPSSGTLAYCSNGTTPPACTGGSLTTVSSATPLTPAQMLSLYFTPAPGTTGTPAFTYTATSANGTSNTATVSMPIYNLPPVATSTITAPVTQNSTANTSIPALQATDIDGTVASYSVTAPAAAQGTLKYCAAAPTACTPASLTSITASGTVSLTPAQSASLTFTPANGFSGTAAFTFTATDNSSNVSNAATVEMPVTPGGLAPANMPPVTQSYVTEPISNTAGNTPVPGLMGTDPDGSIAAYTITTPPAAADGTLKYCAAAPAACTPASLTSVPATGTTSLTPAQAATLQFSPNPANAGGLASFSYSATDNFGTPATSNISTVSIPVQNPAPAAMNVTTNPVTPGSSNTPVSGPVATDNGTIATYTVTTAPDPATQGTLSYCSNGTSPCTGTVTPVVSNTPLTPAQAATLSFTPVPGFTGTVPVPYTATDNNGLSGNPATLTIPVNSTLPPTAANYNAAAINANSATAASLSTALSGTVNAANAGGTISSYTVASVPPATQGTLKYCAAAPTACTPAALTTVAAGASLTPVQAATLSFTPVATYAGPVSFAYTATDNQGLVSNLATVNVPVSNTAPVANNVTTAATTPGGAAVTVPIAGTDPDGSVSSYKITSLPPATQGTLTYCNTGVLPGCTQTAVTAGQVLTPAQAATVKLTPAATATTADVSFTYTVTDNTGAVSNTATASVPVDPIVPKAAVVAQNITTLPANGAQKVPALVAADQGGSPITGYTVNVPTSGTLAYCSNGASAPACTGGTLTTVSGATPLTPGQMQSLYFTPATGTTGTPSFTYTATSENGISNTAVVSMPIYNLPPTATSTVTAPVAQNSTGNTAMPPLQATDMDGTVSTYSVTAPAAAQGTLKYCAAAPAACTPASLTSIAASGTVSLTPAQSASLTFTPANGFTGTAAFTFTATDNNSNVSNAATVRIPVTPGGLAPANMPPVTQSYVTEPISNTAGNTPVPGLLGTDPDGSIAGYTITTAPTAAQGTLKYCAAAPTACTPASLTSVPVAGTTALTPAQAASLQFSPNPANAGGLASFSYSATDNFGTPATSNISTVSIPVQNPAPLAMNVSSNTVTAGSANTPVSGLKATDNGSITNYTITTAPTAAQGTLKYCAAAPTACTAASLTSVPAAGTTSLTPAQAATLAFTPAAGFTGTVPVPYTATDNNGLVSNAATLSIPVNTTAPPKAVDYTAAPVNANSATSASLASAMSATVNAANVGGTISSYTVASVPPATQGTLSYCAAAPAACTAATLTTAAAGASLTPAQAATLSFMPVATYSGPVSFAYTATDNQGLVSNLANVNVPVSNQPPVANNLTTAATTPGGAAVTVPIAGSDPDGSVSSYVINSLPPAAQGTLSYCSTGSLPGCTQTAVTAGQTLTPAQAATVKFTPATTTNTADVSFTYSVTDNTGATSNTATASIPLNDAAPKTVIIAQNITTAPANGAQKVPALVAADQGGSPITAYTVSAPTSGTLQYCSNGATPPACTGGSLTTVSTTASLTPAQMLSLYFTPATGTTGTPTFTYTATSANGTSNTATVSMPIYNLPPVATSTVTAPVRQNSTANTALPPLQATDVDGTVASYSVTPPAAAQGILKYCTAGSLPLCTGGTLTTIGSATTLTPAQAATLAFVPANGFSGTASFPFTATDNNGNVSNAATVEMPVTPGGLAPANMPPVTQSFVTEPISNTAGSTPIPGLMGTDPDGSIAGYTITTPPAAADGTLKYCATAPAACTAASLTSVPATGTTTLTPAQAASLQFSPNPANAGGLATFSYTATDNFGTPATSNISTVSIPVQNPAPAAMNVTTNPVTPGSSNTPVSGPVATDNGTIATYTVTTAPDPVTQGTLSYCSNGTSPCTGTVTPIASNTPLTPAQAATLSFTPVPGFTGTVVVPYTATDNNGLSGNPATLTIPVNSTLPPTAANYNAAAINANSATSASLATALSGTVNAANVGGTISSYTVASVPPATQGTLKYCAAAPAACTPAALTTVAAGASLTPVQAATLSFTPVATYAGPVSFAYTATDNQGLVSNLATVNVPVSNTAPVANNVTTAATTPGGAAVTVPIAGTDPDGSVSSYKITSLPPATQGTLTYCNTGVLPGCTQTAVTAGQVLTPAQAATVKLTPAATATTADVSFTYTVTDNTGAVSNTATASVPVDPIVPKAAVVAQNITTAPANGAQKVPALVAADQGGSPITGYTVNAPTSGTLQYCSNGASAPACTGGTLTTVSGSTPLTPGQMQSLYFTPAAGTTGTPSFTYTATSENGTSNTATVSMPIYNLPPTATSFTTAQVIANSTANAALPPLQATDMDGTVSSYSVTAPAAAQGMLKYCAAAPTACTAASLTTISASGTVSLTPAQSASLTFTPATGFTGTAAFTFTATDNNSNVSNIAAVNIPVTPLGATPVNVAPITQSFITEPISNTAGNIAIPGLMGTDPDGSIAGYTITTPPTAAQGTLKYCAAAPTACTAASLTSVPATGTTALTPAQAATLQFSPNPANAGGMASFSYSATDNFAVPATSNISTVSIPVQNPAPLAMNVSSNTVTAGSANTPVSGLKATDNGSITNYTITTAPTAAQGTLKYCAAAPTACTAASLTSVPAAGTTSLTPAQAATLAFTPAAGFTGTVPVPYTATDNNGLVSNAATLSIPVNTTAPPKAVDYTAAPVNANSATSASLASAMSATVNAANVGGTISSYTVASVPPATQGTLSYCAAAPAACTAATLTTAAAGASLTPAQAATLSFMPVATYSGPVSFAYTATDNQGLVSNLANVNVPVSNQPPVANNLTTAATTPGGAAVTVPIAGSDPDGSVSSYVINSLPPAAQGTLSYCSTGSLPGCTQTAVTAGQTLTPAQAATVTFTPSSASKAFEVSFNYSTVDNTGASSNLGTATIPMNSITPLPIELISFEAKEADACTVSLEWQTAHEKGMDYFAVERSTDGSAWDEVRRTKATGGTAAKQVTYQTTDRTPQSGTNYYRLRMAELDGSSRYSNVVSVRTHCETVSVVTVRPNPFTERVTVSGMVPGSVISLWSVDGRKVYEGESRTATMQITLTDLPSGHYLLRVAHDGITQEVKQLVKE